MARKKIREHDAKRLLRTHFARLVGRDLPIHVAQVTSATDHAALLQAHPWLTTSKLVVKAGKRQSGNGQSGFARNDGCTSLHPDMLFGQRGKHDLVGLNFDWPEAEAFIRARLNKVVKLKNGCEGPVTTFIVEPFVAHQEEYYLSITSNRLDYEVSFSPAGGMDVEEHWDQLRSVKLDTLEALDSQTVAPLTAGMPLELKPQLEAFIIAVFQVFLDLDMTLLEMNPFTFDASGQPFPLDIRMELDDTAKFRCRDGRRARPDWLCWDQGQGWGQKQSQGQGWGQKQGQGRGLGQGQGQGRPRLPSAKAHCKGGATCVRPSITTAAQPPDRSGPKWGDVDFPLPFGRTQTPSEEFVHSLDEATGASLKFTVLNPQGHVWLMVAGGGASVIYTDTVADLGYAQELGNYGEYSGAPNTGETYQYANTVLACATSHLDSQPRALLIGGGIANFTDVAATFQGIIMALREHAEALRAAKMRIFVRRGGPNYQKGLALMRALGVELALPIQVGALALASEAMPAQAIADAVEEVLDARVHDLEEKLQHQQAAQRQLRLENEYLEAVVKQQELAMTTTKRAQHRLEAQLRKYQASRGSNYRS
ncbi:hypothetical protein QJQ45_004496 [Haematococcus lacustris]|nr:hypothetical protein QJQ45_004496 [Haematococcus lacustris]